MQHSEIVPASEIYHACGITSTHASQERREAWAEQCDLAVTEMAHMMAALDYLGSVIANRLLQAQAIWLWATEIIGMDASIEQLSDGRYIVRKMRPWQTPTLAGG